MKANHRFALVGIALSCLACAGLILASLAPEDHGTPETGADLRAVEHLRPSLAASPAAGATLAEDDFADGTTAARLSFAPPLFDDLSLLEGPYETEDSEETAVSEETAEAGTDPDSWSVAVEERPVTSARPPTSVARPGSSPQSAAKRRHYTLKQRLAEIAPAAQARLVARFEAAKAPWPPAEVSLIAIKDQKAIELHARAAGGSWQLVDRYKVLAASGKSGPKLLMGDKQVPEGVYRISYLNPNSAFHVSLRVDYPNAFDRAMAARDGRKALGGDIMIHGKNQSAGCLAVGDPAAEELFVLAALVGLKNVRLVIAPTDFRRPGAMPVAQGPVWLPQLYADIAGTMTAYPTPPQSTSRGLLSLLGL